MNHVSPKSSQYRAGGNGGYAMLAVLWLGALIGILTLTVAKNAELILGVQRNQLHHFSARQEATNNSIRAFEADVSPLGFPQYICATSTGTAGKVSLKRLTCGIHHVTDISLLKNPLIDGRFLVQAFPAFDYSAYFASPCYSSFNYRPCDDRSSLGHALSPGSLCSNYIRTVSDSDFSERFCLRANAAGNTRLTFRGNVIAAVSGYLDLMDLGLTSGNATLIAGGDILIARLRTKDPTDLSLISASGRIEIGGITGPVSLNLAAPQGIQIPPNSTLRPGPWPPLQQHTAFAISAVEH